MSGEQGGILGPTAVADYEAMLEATSESVSTDAPAPESRPDVAVCPRCADNGHTIPVHAHARTNETDFEHRCPICHHEWTITRTPQELAPPRAHAELHRARTALKHAALMHGIWWQGPRSNHPSGGYVKAGHDAVTQIDEALKTLYAARGALVAQLRRDEDLSALRVDALLASRRTPDTTTTPGDPAPEAADQAHTNP